MFETRWKDFQRCAQRAPRAPQKWQNFGFDSNVPPHLTPTATTRWVVFQRTAIAGYCCWGKKNNPKKTHKTQPHWKGSNFSTSPHLKPKNQITGLCSESNQKKICHRTFHHWQPQLSSAKRMHLGVFFVSFWHGMGTAGYLSCSKFCRFCWCFCFGENW